MWKAAEDAIIGEVKVAEQVIDDLSGSAVSGSPGVTIPIKKF